MFVFLGKCNVNIARLDDMFHINLIRYIIVFEQILLSTVMSHIIVARPNGENLPYKDGKNNYNSIHLHCLSPFILHGLTLWSNFYVKGKCSQ